MHIIKKKCRKSEHVTEHYLKPDSTGGQGTGNYDFIIFYTHYSTERKCKSVYSIYRNTHTCNFTGGKCKWVYVISNIILQKALFHTNDITGGKWTTYRHMAEETLDKAVEVCGLKPSKPCQTKGLLLDGAHGWTPTLFIRLVQDFGLENEVRSAFAVNI